MLRWIREAFHPAIANFWHGCEGSMSTYELPDESAENLESRASEDVKAFDAFATRMSASAWEIQLGAIFDEMVSDRSASQRALEYPNAQVRRAAVWLIGTYWPVGADFIPGCVRAAFRDADSLVRGGAIFALWRLGFSDDDPTGSLGDLLRRIRIRHSPPSHGDERKSVMYALPDFIRQQMHGIWQELAGLRLPEMLRSRGAAEAFLDDPDPRLRCAAIHLVDEYWKSDDAFVRRCEEMARGDPDFTTRQTALGCVASFYRGSNDPRIGRLCAEIICSESYPRAFRKAAYAELMCVIGEAPISRIRVRLDTFRFPEEVDWCIVRSFLQMNLGSRGDL